MNKRNLICCVVLVGLCSSAAVALDPMGPPKASLDMGKWSLGADYSHSDMDILRKTANWSDAKSTINVKVDKLYANAGYGLSDNVTGFVRVGAGIADSDVTASWTEWEGDGDLSFIWGGGFRATVIDNEKLDWGLLAQLGRGYFHGDTKASTGEKAEYDIRMSEIQIAIGPTYQFTSNIQIYGGPFAYFLDGEYKDSKENGDRLYKPIEEKSAIGGYVGALMNIKEKCDINTEFQYTGKAWAIGAGLTFPF